MLGLAQNLGVLWESPKTGTIKGLVGSRKASEPTTRSQY